MEQLYCVMYTSELAPSESSACVSGIVKTSRANNGQSDVSGILIFDGNAFCQYLEGAKAVVMSLIETIQSDSRHTNFGIRYQGDLEGERRFSGWSIAYAYLQELEIERRFFDALNDKALEIFETLLPRLDLQPG